MRTMFTVVVLGLGAVLSPAEVQQAARIPRVGFLSPVNPPTPTVPQPAFEGFLKGLADSVALCCSSPLSPRPAQGGRWSRNHEMGSNPGSRDGQQNPACPVPGEPRYS